MDDSNVILTLLAIDSYAGRLFNHPHNTPYYREPSFALSRESTPLSTACEQNFQYPHSRLELTFDQKPKNPDRGFTFGSSRKQCDILFSKEGISQVHFSVTFDYEGRLLMKDTSTNGTWVSLRDHPRSSESRNQFTLVLSTETSFQLDFGDDHTPSIVLVVPERRADNKDFEAKLALYLKRAALGDPSLNLLDISSQVTTI